MASEQIETVGQCAWCLQRDRQAFALVCPEHVNQFRVLLDDLQRDIQALCRAVGEFDGARPETPQVVLQICTDKAARLQALLAERDAEIKGLREALEEYADQGNWWQARHVSGDPLDSFGDLPRMVWSWNDMREPWTMARAALAARGGAGADVMTTTSVSVALSNVAAWVFGLLCGTAFGIWIMGKIRGWRR